MPQFGHYNHQRYGVRTRGRIFDRGYSGSGLESIFGQGPWTPWQMFCWGMIGFGAGLLRNAGFLKGKLSLSIYGLAAGFAFGWVMNLWFIIGFVNPITWQAIAAAYISSFWFDFTNALSTLIFVFVLSEPWLKKLDRIKTKFGLME